MLEQWSINRLAKETGLDRRTIESLLVGAPAAGKGTHGDLYHLSDLIESMRHQAKKDASHEAEKKRKTTEEADKLAIDNEVSRRVLVDLHTFYRESEPIAISIKQIILNSGLSEEEKNQIQDAIHKLYPDAPREEAERSQSPGDAGQDL